jgi:anti-sigma factor RsiW
MISRLVRLFRRHELDCGEVRAASSDFIDGELGTAESSRIRSHLERCGPCTAFVRTLRATIEMLGSTAASGAPAGFRERVQERIRSG